MEFNYQNLGGMKIELELWMLYFFEARKDANTLMDLYSAFSRVASDYPLVEAYAVRAMYMGYMSELITT